MLSFSREPMPSEKVIELRRHLREKFPAAHRFAALAELPTVSLTQPPQTCSYEPAYEEDVGALVTARCVRDEAWGKLVARQSPLQTSHPPPPLLAPPAGTLAEITAPGPASGLSLVLSSLLAQPESPESPTTGRPLVLIDARDSFDPASFAPNECARILWVRCRQTDDALRAADLLLRDGNLPLVVLDLASLPERELRRVPLSAWHRLRQLAATTRTTLLALTPAPAIPCAQVRLILDSAFSLDHLNHPRLQLLPLLSTQPTRHLQAQ